ncbi:MAG: hypothetical protein JWP91_3440 [Fibrobacteres bacterium]|nr:hypothetical protein [Fibrobacterota bacterium]
MKNLVLAATLSGLCLTGCSVMHFKNGDVASAGHVQEKWHHNGILSLMEFSPVINMKTLCPEKSWSMITTKDTFLTVLAGSVDDVVTAGIARGASVDLWNPQAIEWFCGAEKSGSAVAPASADSAR